MTKICNPVARGVDKTYQPGMYDTVMLKDKTSQYDNCSIDNDCRMFDIPCVNGSKTGGWEGGIEVCVYSSIPTTMRLKYSKFEGRGCKKYGN